MLFDKEKYYKYSKDIKFQIGLIVSINTIIATFGLLILPSLISNLLNGNYIIITAITIIFTAIFITNLQTKNLEIKLQEMYWKLDTYEKIMKKEGN